MLVLRWWPDPMPPTYLCRQPRASEWPVRVTTSRADFNLPQLYWAISAMKRASPTTWAIRPSASPAAQRRIGLELPRAPYNTTQAYNITTNVQRLELSKCHVLKSAR
ncbi:hypothetical protein NP493_734g02033 [Ridgeia piscesae]|uniref:Uncharacterized protein n=1 Tax=Ridgeia piscesae TaxID=27915 RepID=A0AAD9NP16_RIDPI|nr:hypothetical protein NP493_734g02033 [Ridgeia piscesae]